MALAIVAALAWAIVGRRGAAAATPGQRARAAAGDPDGAGLQRLRRAGPEPVRLRRHRPLHAADLERAGGRARRRPGRGVAAAPMAGRRCWRCCRWVSTWLAWSPSNRCRPSSRRTGASSRPTTGRCWPRCAREGVTHVWLNHWASQPLMFDARAAGQPLVAYDWYDVAGGRHRPLPRVPAAARTCGAARLRAGHRRRGAGAGAPAARARGVDYVASARAAVRPDRADLAAVHPSEVGIGAGLSVLVAWPAGAWGKFPPMSGPHDRPADLMGTVH